jgi:hypothetical protein
VGVLAEYVTLEQGTGAVHTAPGHGADDFLTGMKYGLDIYAPVGPAGHFLDSVELFGGQRVFDANPHVEEALKARARLWHARRCRINTRTAGVVTIQSSSWRRRSGSCGWTATRRCWEPMASGVLFVKRRNMESIMR